MMSGMYSIPLAGLREGKYTYEFNLGDDFFKAFEESEIKKGDLMADVTLDKGNRLLELKIVINGEVEVMCDRCLDFFPLKISSSNRLFIKQGDDWDDSDPELITMPADEYQLNMSQYFYEYIHLALPIQRIHPIDKQGRSMCDPEMLNKLREHVSEDKNATDPRWDGLKKIK
jgi:uncharacterized protein